MKSTWGTISKYEKIALCAGFTMEANVTGVSVVVGDKRVLLTSDETEDFIAALSHFKSLAVGYTRGDRETQGRIIREYNL